MKYLRGPVFNIVRLGGFYLLAAGAALNRPWLAGAGALLLASRWAWPSTDEERV